MDKITQATNEWAAEKLGIRPNSIQAVTFGVMEVGCCEQCMYPEPGATVYLKNGDFEEISGLSIEEVIRELVGRLA